jgi:hypothetical protein
MVLSALLLVMHHGRLLPLLLLPPPLLLLLMLLLLLLLLLMLLMLLLLLLLLLLLTLASALLLPPGHYVDWDLVPRACDPAQVGYGADTLNGEDGEGTLDEGEHSQAPASVVLDAGQHVSAGREKRGERKRVQVGRWTLCSRWGSLLLVGGQAPPLAAWKAV